MHTKPDRPATSDGASVRRSNDLVVPASRGHASCYDVDGIIVASAHGTNEGNMRPAMRQTAIINVALLIATFLAFPDGRAQSFPCAPVTMQIEDQRGYVPDLSAAQLPAAYRRQVDRYLQMFALGHQSSTATKAIGA
jgi:hypothetical protein